MRTMRDLASTYKRLTREELAEKTDPGELWWLIGVGECLGAIGTAVTQDEWRAIDAMLRERVREMERGRPGGATRFRDLPVGTRFRLVDDPAGTFPWCKLSRATYCPDGRESESRPAGNLDAPVLAAR